MYIVSFDGDHHSTTPGWSLYVSQSTPSGRELHMVPVFASKTMRVCCSCCDVRNKCSLHVTCQRKCILSLSFHSSDAARATPKRDVNGEPLVRSKDCAGSSVLFSERLSSSTYIRPLHLCRYHSAGPEPIGGRDRSRDLSPRSHKGG